MVDENGKEILKNIVVNPTLDREHIKKELSKIIKSKSEKLKEIEIEQSKNRKNKETSFNKNKTNLQQYTKNYTTKNFNHPKEQQLKNH